MERGRGGRELALSISNILIKAERIPPEGVACACSSFRAHSSQAGVDCGGRENGVIFLDAVDDSGGACLVLTYRRIVRCSPR